MPASLPGAATHDPPPGSSNIGDERGAREAVLVGGRRRERAVRLGLLALAVPNGVVATWISAAPASFYTDFPGFGRYWVTLLPPYNAHLMNDFGSALLALAGVLLLAAVTLERRLVQTALVAVLLQGLPHAGYHLKTFGALPSLDAFAHQAAVTFAPGLALVLLMLSRGLNSSEVRWDGATGALPEKREPSSTRRMG